MIIAGRINALLWIVSGLAILISGFWYRQSIIIHIVVAVAFAGLGIFFYLKAGSMQKLSERVRLLSDTSVTATVRHSLNKALYYEHILIAVSLLVIILAASGIIARIFFEGLAVFG